jgi:hypothetical protein
MLFFLTNFQNSVCLNFFPLVLFLVQHHYEFNFIYAIYTIIIIVFISNILNLVNENPFKLAACACDLSVSF